MPTAASGRAVLSQWTHSHPGSWPCASNPSRQAFSCADFQEIQASLDVQDHWQMCPLCIQNLTLEAMLWVTPGRGVSVKQSQRQLHGRCSCGQADEHGCCLDLRVEAAASPDALSSHASRASFHSLLLSFTARKTRLLMLPTSIL